MRPADVPEETAGEPAAVAEANARRKAETVAAALHGEASEAAGATRWARADSPPGAGASRKATAAPLVLGADTDVAVDGDILGKPADAVQARAYLSRLAGRTHEVVGGIALARPGEPTRSAVETTRVRFRALDARILDWYVATGEWEGRAGGYAIQGAGAALVAAIEGDYLNVVGLPLALLLDMLPEALAA